MSDENGAAASYFEHPEVAFSDHRGTITDLVQGESFEAASLITSSPGAVRGNHYHEDTYQIIYLISGKLRVVTQMPGRDKIERTAVAGDLIRTPPEERHALETLEEATMFVLTRGPRSGQDYESDTIRLSEPLIAP
ncbi:MAG TPA: cupin domain-containing protein [Acidimicrobiales bacterium]|nr:cupin domain-containing protein [Acidimicrobiales bacterium]